MLWIRHRRVDSLVSTLDLRNQFEVSRIGGMTFDEQGTLFFTESTIHRVFRIDTASLKMVLVAGSTEGFKDGIGDGAQFSYPRGIASDKRNNMYIADSDNAAIRKINLMTSSVSTVIEGVRAIQMCIQNKWLYFTQTLGVTKLDLETNQAVKIKVIPLDLLRVTPGIPFEYRIKCASGISIDGNGAVYVCDIVQSCIFRITDSTTRYGTFSDSPKDGYLRETTFNYPDGCCITSNGNLLVSDSRNFIIRVLDFTTGMVATIAGNGISAITDGLSPKASFCAPTCIATFGTHIYVADEGCIRKISKVWEVIRLLWIGKLKHTGEECVLAWLPREIVNEIKNWICGTVIIREKRKMKEEPSQPPQAEHKLKRAKIRNQFRF